MKRQNIKPALGIRAGSEQIKNFGEIYVEEENSAEVLRYQILNGTDLRDLILRKDVVFEFPNSKIEIWNTKNSDEITKFFSRCASK